MNKISGLDNITEYAMSLDSFLNPTTYKGRSAVEILLCRLILLEPGTFETHPNMGVGIVSRFRNIKENELSELDTEIESQITTYLPFVYGVKVQTKFIGNKQMRIAIKVNEEIFALTYNQSNSNLTSEKLALDSFV